MKSKSSFPLSIASFFCVLFVSVFMLTGCGAGTQSASSESTDSESVAADAQSAESTESATSTGSGEKSKEITVVAGSLFPVIYLDDKGEVAGFEHDVIEAIAKKNNWTVKWEKLDDYTAMFAGLDSGAYDTIAGQISYTEERAKTYQFSDKYTANEIKMCVHKDDPAKSVDDLKGRKVLIEFGTVLETYFNDFNKDLPDKEKAQLVTTSGSAYEELNAEHIDAFPITVMSFDEMMKKGKYDFKLIGDPIIVDYQAFPFAKTADPALVEGFNTAIRELQKDGTMKSLSEKYFGRDFTTFEAK